MWIGRRTVTGALIAAVACALLPSPGTVLVVANALLLVLVAADVALAPSPREVGFERSLPYAMRTDTSSEVRYRLQNPSPRRARLWFRDAVTPSLTLDPDAHEVTLASQGWTRVVSIVTPRRRGRIPVGPVHVRTAGPLGLAGRQSTRVDRTSATVYPSLPGGAHVAVRLERARLLGGRRTAAVRGGGTDFDTLREYSVDDEFRRINWRATARVGHAVTNIYREERNQSIVILLDASRAMAQSVQGAPRFEHGLDAAIALARVASGAGDHVGALAFATDVLAFEVPRSGRTQPRRLLDLLFAIEPVLDAGDYTRAFATLLARHRRRSLLVLLTEPAHEAVLDPLFRALPMLTRRHLVLIGSVLDPEMERAASATPATSEEVYLKGAAAVALAERARAIDRLRALGADVIDRLPGDLPGALVDRYLRVKAYGRL